MSYRGESYRRVIVPLVSRVRLPEIIQLARETGGTFIGEDWQGLKKAYISIFDFKDKSSAETFKVYLRNEFGKQLAPGMRSYSDYEYD